MAKPKKTTLELLQEAIASGDLDKAGKLTAKLAKESSKPPAPSPGRRKSPLILPPSCQEVDATSHVEGEGDFDPRQSSWMAPSRKPESEQAPVTKVMRDGKTGTIGRLVSMKGSRFSNEFKDNGKGGIEGRFAQVDRANGRKEAAIDRRPPARKQEVACEGCRRNFSVYPSEMRPSYQDNASAELIYECERCIKKGK